MDPRTRIIQGLIFNSSLNETAKRKRCPSEKNNMPRKIRSDASVGTAEKKLGVPPGTFRNKDGRDTRSDKKIGTVRRDDQD